MKGQADHVTLGFGGGCHWCTEAVFQPLRGICAVRQGFIAAAPPHDTFSEAVEVEFDADRIGLRDLVAVHVATHASTAHHSMRGKYRSALYAADPDLRAACRDALAALEDETGLRFVTQVLEHRGFRASDARFHDYYATDPERPFYRTYIEPKLTKIRARFATLLAEA